MKTDKTQQRQSEDRQGSRKIRLRDLIGAAKGAYASADEADAEVAASRNE